MRKYLSFYHIAHGQRVKLYDLRWRVFFIFLTAIALILTKEYLDFRYPFGVYDPLRESTFVLSERVFEWFGYGILFGIIAVSLMHEGEFLLQLRRFVKGIELQTAPKNRPKAVRPKTLKKSRKG